MLTYAQLHSVSLSDLEVFDYPPPAYPDEIDEAPDGILRSWIIEAGTSADDIDMMLDAGLSLRDIAVDLNILN